VIGIVLEPDFDGAKFTHAVECPIKPAWTERRFHI